MTVRDGSLGRFGSWWESNQERMEALQVSPKLAAFNAWCEAECQEHATMQAQLDAANAKVAEAVRGLEAALQYVGNECYCYDDDDKEFLCGLVSENELNQPCW